MSNGAPSNRWGKRGKSRNIGAAEEEDDARRRHRTQMAGGGVGLTVTIGLLVLTCLGAWLGAGYSIHSSTHTDDIIKEYHSRQDVGNPCLKVEFSSNGGHTVHFKANGAKCPAVCYDDYYEEKPVDGRCSTQSTCCGGVQTLCVGQNCSGVCAVVGDCVRNPNVSSTFLDSISYTQEPLFDASCNMGICVWTLVDDIVTAMNYTTGGSSMDDVLCSGTVLNGTAPTKGCLVSSGLVDGAGAFNGCQYTYSCAVDQTVAMASSASSLLAGSVFGWAFMSLYQFFTSF